MCRCNKISVLFLIYDIRNCAIGTVGAVDVLFMCLEYDLKLFTPHNQQFAVAIGKLYWIMWFDCMRCVAFFLDFLFQMLVHVFLYLFCSLLFAPTMLSNWRLCTPQCERSEVINIEAECHFIQTSHLFKMSQKLKRLAWLQIRICDRSLRYTIHLGAYRLTTIFHVSNGHDMVFFFSTSLFHSFKITKTQHAHWKCCRSARWLHFT